MFASLFTGKKPSPANVVNDLRDAVSTNAAPFAEARAAEDTKAETRIREDVSKHVFIMKQMIFGDVSERAKSAGDGEIASFVGIACESDLILLLAQNLRLMVFEARKDAVQIFTALWRYGRLEKPDTPDGQEPQSILQQAETFRGPLLSTLVTNYEDNEIALNGGAMLRECLREESLAMVVLDSGDFWTFFKLVEKSDFDVASDAFATFKDLLTRHPQMVASFLVANLDRFVSEYNGLLRSSNYVTRRQSLKLLGEMLLERANFRIMKTYISSAENLKLTMNLLLDSRRNIQFEAFHVFKVFVANPHKTPEVQQILVRNKTKMLEYLSGFLVDRDDEQFQQDRYEVLQVIQEIDDSTVQSAKA